MSKQYLDKNVLQVAQERIRYIFDEFEKVYLSFSGGKDSSVMMHLVMNEAIKRNRKIGILFVDLEAQYKFTIVHIQEMLREYKEHIEIYWIALPIALRNAVSMHQPKWTAWEPNVNWVREKPEKSISDVNYFKFYKYNMEFEEFVPLFGEWFSDNKNTACLVGIRADESLNRYRTIVREKKARYKKLGWTTKVTDHVYNCYPIYDWRTEDIWIYNGKENKSYNKLYDMMYKAGVSIHQQRICQPYGDDQRKGLWLFHLIEPETWPKIISRVCGANFGSIYAKESGNILGNIKIERPEGLTWFDYVCILLDSLPEKSKEHFLIKIEEFLSWWENKGGVKRQNVPDEVDPKLEASKKYPSWRRIAKAILKNDYWCKSLSFGMTKSYSYEKYRKRKRRFDYAERNKYLNRIDEIQKIKSRES